MRLPPRCTSGAPRRSEGLGAGLVPGRHQAEPRSRPAEPGATPLEGSFREPAVHHDPGDAAVFEGLEQAGPEFRLQGEERAGRMAEERFQTRRIIQREGPAADQPRSGVPARQPPGQQVQARGRARTQVDAVARVAETRHQTVRQQQLAHAHRVQPDPAALGQVGHLGFQPEPPGLRQAPGAGPRRCPHQRDRRPVAEVEEIHESTLS